MKHNMGLVISKRAVEEVVEDVLNQDLKDNAIQDLAVKVEELEMDLGEVVVHVMGEAEREYYKLEELWGKEAVVYHY